MAQLQLLHLRASLMSKPLGLIGSAEYTDGFRFKAVTTFPQNSGNSDDTRNPRLCQVPISLPF